MLTNNKLIVMDPVKYAFVLCLLQSRASARGMEGFIIGGENASIYAYPHSVFLSANCGSKWMCGGAILNQWFVITAGHCVAGCEHKKGYRVRVSVGSSNLNKMKIKRTVKSIAVHKNYNEITAENDIALAMLDKIIPFGRTTKRVIISSSFPRSKYASVAGWGVINDQTGDTSVHLKKLAQKIRSKITCSEIGILHAGMLCAGETEYHADRPDEGDSGSALITDSHIQIGIVSFYVPKYPALTVYTNISYYYSWIERNVKKLYC